MTIEEIIEKEGNNHKWIYTTKNGLEYKCFINRNEYSKTWNGYIFLDPSDRDYGKDYSEIDIDVHGGLTYGGFVDNGFMIGFDCAHAGYKIFYENYGIYMGGVYRDKEYVINECESIAEQLSEVNISYLRNETIDKIIKNDN